MKIDVANLPAQAKTVPEGASIPERITEETPVPLADDAEGWQRLRGFLADEPLFEEWQEMIAERRRLIDANYDDLTGQ